MYQGTFALYEENGVHFFQSCRTSCQVSQSLRRLQSMPKEHVFEVKCRPALLVNPRRRLSAVTQRKCLVRLKRTEKKVEYSGRLEDRLENRRVGLDFLLGEESDIEC